MESEKIILVPFPKRLDFEPGYHTIKMGSYLSLPAEDKPILFSVAQRLQKIILDSVKVKLPIIIGKTGQPGKPVVFERVATLPEEGYMLDIDQEGIRIGYGDGKGAFHAVSTVKQLLCQSGKVLPCLSIEDSPDFKARGVMLDISRNRIPTMATLYRIVDFMADLKLNQLQLYIEGFSFAYPSFPAVWGNGTPITGEEMVLLDMYCRDRFIELVPNQNSFGHMAPWLSRREFNDLAECPDGCRLEDFGWDFQPFTFNPLDPRCISFVENMYDDLLLNFTSEYFNVGLDETLDLGYGKSRELCERIGKGRVYLDYLIKIYDLVKRRDKKMMFWGDIIVQHPELIPELPKDIIALEWGYNADQPSMEDCEKFMQSGIPYYVCPGTSCWNSITGLTDNMKSNLLNAAVLGKKYNAIGYLNTDWGSPNHWQHLPVSYAGFCYGAALSWGVEKNKNTDIAAYLNRFVFFDRNEIMGRLVLDLGNYYLVEQKTAFDGSGIFRTLYFSQLNDKNHNLDFLKLPELEIKDFNSVKEYVCKLLKELDRADMQCGDAELIDAEFRNAIKLILHGTKLGLFKLESHSEEEKGQLLKEMVEDITEIIKDYKEVWLKRNRLGGLDESVKKLEDLKSQYIEALENIYNICIDYMLGYDIQHIHSCLNF